MIKSLFSMMVIAVMLLFCKTAAAQINVEGENVSARFDISVLTDQYFRTNITASRISWNIFKPGLYATDGIVLEVATNKTVELTFEGVEELEPDQEGDIVASTAKIPTWYAFQISEINWAPPEGDSIIYDGPEIAELTRNYNLTWNNPEDLNSKTIEIQYAGNCLVHIWNKIEVKADHWPGTYIDPEGFTLTLTQVE